MSNTDKSVSDGKNVVDHVHDHERGQGDGVRLDFNALLVSYLYITVMACYTLAMVCSAPIT
jgi:hypothetical protein